MDFFITQEQFQAKEKFFSRKTEGASHRGRMKESRGGWEPSEELKEDLLDSFKVFAGETSRSTREYRMGEAKRVLEDAVRENAGSTEGSSKLSVSFHAGLNEDKTSLETSLILINIENEKETSLDTGSFSLAAGMELARSECGRSVWADFLMNPESPYYSERVVKSYAYDAATSAAESFALAASEDPKFCGQIKTALKEIGMA